MALGSGINDAPAIKAASVGVSLRDAVAVARDNAKMILCSGSFEALIHTVVNGRNVFETAQRLSTTMLMPLITLMCPFILFLAVDVPLAVDIASIAAIHTLSTLPLAVASAWDGPYDDDTLLNPPRTASNHILSLSTVLVANLTGGILILFAGFFSFVWSFTSSGWGISQLAGAGRNYRDPVAVLTPSRQQWFADWCQSNPIFASTYSSFSSNTTAIPAIASLTPTPSAVASGLNQGLVDDCYRYRIASLGAAQAAYFLTVMIGIITFGMVHRSRSKSIFITSFWIPFFERGLAPVVAATVTMIFTVLIVHAPGLNTAFFGFTEQVLRSEDLSVGLWIIPLVVMVEEVRKWIVRHRRN